MTKARQSLVMMFLVLLTAGVILITGCAPAAVQETPQEPMQEEAAQPVAEVEEPTPIEAEQEKVLRVALTTNPNTIELATGDSIVSAQVAVNIFDSLVFLNAEGTLEPSLAESWTISDDGLVYTFNLRQGVTFHNGYPFTAEDVKFTWERGTGADIAYRDAFLSVSAVNIVDEYKVEINLSEPNAMLLSQMFLHWSIISKQHHEKVGEEAYLQNPIGTGPFKFVEWIHGDRIVLEANENYWRTGYPKVDRIIFRPILESETRFVALVNDEVDIITNLTPDQAREIEDISGVNLISYPLDRAFYIAFNNMTTGVGTPIENQLVRQAMSYAIDYQTIIDRIFGGQASRIAGFVLPGNLGFDPSIEPFPYNPDRARQLLEEAGFPDGFEISMAGPVDTYVNFEQVLQALVGYWEDVGITVNLEFMESGRFWTLQGNRELPPLFGDSWSSSLGEAFPRLAGSVGGEDAGFAAWLDPVLVEMVGRLQLTPDRSERAELYTQILRYMREDPPFIYLYQMTAFDAANTRVKDFQPRVSGVYFLKGVSLE